MKCVHRCVKNVDFACQHITIRDGKRAQDGDITLLYDAL